MSVSLNAVPAVCVVGVGTVNVEAVAGLTAKVAEVPVSAPRVAVSVVLWASKSVMEAMPTPLVKVTEAG